MSIGGNELEEKLAPLPAGLSTTPSDMTKLLPAA